MFLLSCRHHAEHRCRGRAQVSGPPATSTGRQARPNGIPQATRARTSWQTPQETGSLTVAMLSCCARLQALQHLLRQLLRGGCIQVAVRLRDAPLQPVRIHLLRTHNRSLSNPRPLHSCLLQSARPALLCSTKAGQHHQHSVHVAVLTTQAARQLTREGQVAAGAAQPEATRRAWGCRPSSRAPAPPSASAPVRTSGPAPAAATSSSSTSASCTATRTLPASHLTSTASTCASHDLTGYMQVKRRSNTVLYMNRLIP